MVCAFTGHRPEKLPWGANEEDPRCQALKILIARTVERLVENGVQTFLCGMARGCDLYFAEAVIAVTRQHPEVSLEAWLPCPSQDRCWRAAERLRRDRLLSQCRRVWMVEKQYSEGCMLRRNRAMIDAADGLISVWNGTRGGTGSAVRYAKQQGKWIEALWL